MTNVPIPPDLTITITKCCVELHNLQTIDRPSLSLKRKKHDSVYKQNPAYFSSFLPHRKCLQLF